MSNIRLRTIIDFKTKIMTGLEITDAQTVLSALKLHMQIKVVTTKSGEIEVLKTTSSNEHTCGSSYDSVERKPKIEYWSLRFT